jgi:hypothetical protein
MQSTEQLAALIGRRHQLLVQLRDVGRRQLELVAERDTASLIKLLAVKQSMIATLQTIERDLLPFAADDPEKRVWRSSDQRSKCAEQAAECNAMLREIVNVEKMGVDQMTVHRNEIAEQLQQVHSAVDVRSAYQAQR